MKTLFICLVLLLAGSSLYAFEENLPLKFNRFPSIYANGGLFPDALKSNVYKYQDDIATFAGNTQVHLVNLTSRENLRAWFPGEEVKAAYLDNDGTTRRWYIGYQGYLRILNLETFHGSSVSFSNIKSASDSNVIATIREIGVVGNKIVLHFRDATKIVLLDRSTNAPTYTSGQEISIGIAPTTDPKILNGLGFFFQEVVTGAIKTTNIRVFDQTGILTPPPSALSHGFKYAAISTKTTNPYILIQTSDNIFNVYKIDFVNKNLIFHTKIETTLNTATSRINVVEASFIISDGTKKEIYEITDEKSFSLIFQDDSEDIIYDVYDFVGDSKRSFVQRDVDSFIIGYLWSGDSDNNFNKESAFNYAKPTANLFPEYLKSNLKKLVTAGEYAFVGTKRVFVINWTTRKLVKAIETGVSEEIQASYFFDTKVALGFTGKLVIIDLSDSSSVTYDGITGVVGAIKEIYRVPGKNQLVLHQRLKNNILYDFENKVVLGIFKSTILPDRDPVFVDNKMLVYSSTANYLHYFDVSDVSVPAAAWNHSYTPGINYISRVPGSNYVFIQTNESPSKQYFLWDSVNWNLGSQIQYTSLNSGSERIHAFMPGTAAYLAINQEYTVTLYNFVNGKAVQTYQKSQGKYSDTYTIEGLSNRYLVSNDAPVLRLLDTVTHSILERLTFSDIPNDGIFSDGLNTNVFRIANSELHTYVSKGKIFFIKYPSKRLVSTHTPDSAGAKFGAAYFIQDQNLWILGYENRVVLYNIITHTETPITDNVKGLIKGIETLPAVNKAYLHVRNLPQLMLDIENKKIIKEESYNTSFLLDRTPLMISTVLMAYSPGVLYAELFNISSPSTAPVRWNHKINPGINYIVDIKESNYMLVQAVDKSLYIYRYKTFERVANVSTSLVSPRIFSPAPNTFIVSSYEDYEVFVIDSTGKPSTPSKFRGNNFTDIYHFVTLDGILDYSTNFFVANGNTGLYEYSLKTFQKVLTHLVFQIENVQRLQSSNLVYYAINTDDGDKFVNFENVFDGKTISLWCDLTSLKGSILAIREANVMRKQFLILTDQMSYIWNHYENKLEAEFERAIAASVQSDGYTVLYQSYADKLFKTFNWMTKQIGAFKWQTTYDAIPDGIRAFDSNYAIVTLDAGISHVFARIKFTEAAAPSTNPYYPGTAGLQAKKDSNSCSQTQVVYVQAIGKKLLFTCSENSGKLVAYDPIDNPTSYNADYTFSPATEGRDIDSFFISDHPTDPKIALVTMPTSTTGSQVLNVEIRSLKKNAVDNQNYVIRDALEGSTFIFNLDARLTKLMSHYSVYDIQAACPTDQTDFSIADSVYCYSKCTQKRVVLGDEVCPAKCPTNWLEKDYMGTATSTDKVKVCVPPYTFSPDEAFWESIDQVFEFSAYLTPKSLNSTLCLLGDILYIPAGSVQSEGKSCTPSTSARILQAYENTNRYVVSFFPYMNPQWGLVDYIQGERANIIQKFNKAKSADVPTLLSINDLVLVKQDVNPASQDDIKIGLVRYSLVNSSYVNVTLNVTQANLHLSLAWTDDSKNKTTPNYDNLRTGVDGVGLDLLGAYSTVTKSAGNYTFVFEKAKNTRSSYALFAAAKTYGLASNIQTNVVRFNITVESSFSQSLFIQYITIMAVAVLALFF